MRPPINVNTGGRALNKKAPGDSYL